MFKHYYDLLIKREGCKVAFDLVWKFGTIISLLQLLVYSQLN